MQCMNIEDHLKKTQPKKFAKTSSIKKKKKPKHFQKPKTQIYMNEMHEQEGKQDLTKEKKINLGRKSPRQEVQRERKVFGEVRGQKVLREIGEK